MKYTIYKTETNEIVKLVSCPPSEIANQVSPDEYYTEGYAEVVIVVDKEREARKLRNSLLLQSDWTQVADAPVDQAAWATYRQQLRDVTSQVGFPDNIIWPEAPVQ